ncbi:MAG: hypothetical protein NTY53_24075 [Kiritimatiellaeota bacterium]|nr:hypothetical protein [Kiritimatiellota bacterium]
MNWKKKGGCKAWLSVGLLGAVLMASLPAQAWNSVNEDTVFDASVVARQAVDLRGTTTLSGTANVTGTFKIGGITITPTNTTFWTLPPGYVWVGGAASNATAKALTGPVGIDTNGLTSIGARQVTAAMLPAAPPAQIMVGRVSVVGTNAFSLAVLNIGGTTNTLVFTNGVLKAVN